MLLAIFNRLRFRFSLRALLLAVAIAGALCGWVAVQRRWIRDRQAFVTTYQVWEGKPVLFGSQPVAGERPPAPWPLLWFGEEGFHCVILSEETPSEEFDRIKNLFPEAEVLRVFAHDADARWPAKQE